MEIWKPLRNFPSYDGSSEGRIRNVRTQRILKTTVDQNGYLKACLQKNGEQYTVKVSRVIAETFLGEHPGMDVRPKDGDRLNVNVDNLEWCTRSELIADAYARGSKKPYQSIAVRVVETGNTYESILDCAKDINCDKSQISKCLAGKLTHVKGYHFVRENSLS